MKVTVSLLAALALAVAALTAAPTAASAATLFQNDDVTVNMHAYAQGVAVAQDVPDDVRSKDRLYLFVKEARLRWDGTLYGTAFDIMLAPGAEDLTPNTNSALGLLDFSFEVPVTSDFKIKLGQFLVPYSRERLTDDPTMNFADRSIENLGFSWNRDYGVAFSNYSGKFAGTLAVMTGGGRDVPQRYLPEKLGFPLVAVRFGYNDGIDKDVYHVSARDTDPGRSKSALYFNGLYTKDTEIGHSTVLNIRATDKNLLIDSNYNPFIGKAPFSLATIWQAGADAAYRAPMGAFNFNAEGQVDYSHFDNKYGRLSLKGGRVQAGISKNKWELNLRYSALYLDTRMAYSNAGVSYQITKDKAPLQEITPSLTYHYKPGILVVLDAPYLVKMLVFKEHTIGSYVMSEQPDQVTVIKPGTTAGTGSDVRKNVAEARLMVQLGF
ncbi:MAG TPA: porin [Thermoanaerobaculia bacterium]|nr:porin [Thermoanaerobaculia bacterium]